MVIYDQSQSCLPMSILKQVLKDATKKCKFIASSHPSLTDLVASLQVCADSYIREQSTKQSWNVDGRYPERAGGMGSGKSRHHTAAVPGGFATAAWEPAIAVICAISSRAESSLLW